MNRWLVRVVALGALAVAAAACGGDGEKPNLFGVRSELIAPIGTIDAMAFAPDGRLFLAEHWGGDVRVITADGELLPDPVIHFDIAPGLEWGLTGLAIDPDFEENHFIYVYFAEFLEGSNTVARPVVMRFTESANKGSDPKVIVDDLPDTRDKPPFNASGSIHFGPDGYLYVSIGDFDVPKLVGPLKKEAPQDLGIAMGKVLRVDKADGSAPDDNPFVAESGADPRIFAYGFRENFDFEFDPASGKIFATDNTSVSCEELNVVISGANYGWPKAGEWPYNDCLFAGETAAIHFFAKQGLQPGDFTSVLGIKGMGFVSGDVYPLLGDSLLVCGGENIYRVAFSGADRAKVTSTDLVIEGCQQDIVISPDGIVYYNSDSEIRRLMPVAPATKNP